MEKFKITDTIQVDGKNIYLFNKPFHMRMEEEGFSDTYSGRGISSYHHKLENEADWLIYPSLQKCEIMIVSPSGEFTSEEALQFISINNGIALTRDNLFMLCALFPDRLKEYKGLLAIMHKQFLPNHGNGPKIMPKVDINIEKDYPPEKVTFYYDWWWYDGKQKNPFVFMKPSLIKSYY